MKRVSISVKQVLTINLVITFSLTIPMPPLRDSFTRRTSPLQSESKLLDPNRNRNRGFAHCTRVYYFGFWFLCAHHALTSDQHIYILSQTHTYSISHSLSLSHTHKHALNHSPNTHNSHYVVKVSIGTDVISDKTAV